MEIKTSITDKNIDLLFNLLIIILIMFLLIGQLFRITTPHGLVIYPHDFILLIILLLLPFQSITIHKFKIILLRIPKLTWIILFWFFISSLIKLLLFNSYWETLYLFRLLFYTIALLSIYFNNQAISPLTKKILLSSGITFAFIGLCLYIFIPDTRFLSVLGWDDHYYRYIGTILDPNFTGIILLGSWIAWLLLHQKLIQSSQTNLFDLTEILGTILFGSAIGLTFSRSSWLASGIASLLVAGLPFFSKPAFSKKTNIMLATIFVLCILFSWIIAPKPGGEGVNISRSYSLESRQSHDVEFISKSPIVLLMGSGISPIQSSELDESPSNHARLPNNFFVLIWSFGGLFGLIGFFWIIKKSILFIWKNEPLITIYLIALLIHSLFNSSITEPFVLLLINLQFIGIKSLCNQQSFTQNNLKSKRDMK